MHYGAFLRAEVEPRLRTIGFIGRRATYRYVRDEMHQATIQFRQHRVGGGAGLQFQVDQGLIFKPWLEFSAWASGRVGDSTMLGESFDTVDPAAGPIVRRMRDPGNRLSSGNWNFDGGTPQAQRFLDLLTTDATNLISITEPEEFENQLRGGFPALPRRIMPPPAAILTCLLVSQRRFGEVSSLLDDLTDWHMADDLRGWIDLNKSCEG